MKKLLLDIAAWSARILPDPVIQVIYKFRPLARLIRTSLNKAAPSGLSEVQIAAGDLAGYTIQLDMQIDKDYWLGTYEPELQAALKHLIPPGAVIYDVGANIGYVSLLLAKAAGENGRVFAFEALPSNVRQLQRNLELNQMESRIKVCPFAVADKTGQVSFLVHASGGMGKAVGSAGRDEQYQSEINVESISLDDFVFEQGNPPPTVIKMDIEGGEVMALPGMERILKDIHPLLLMELHGHESSQAAWDTLLSAGYTICWLKEGFPQISSLEEMGWKAYIVARHG
jgi:FkbM family methyltransferase